MTLAHLLLLIIEKQIKKKKMYICMTSRFYSVDLSEFTRVGFNLKIKIASQLFASNLKIMGTLLKK